MPRVPGTRWGTPSEAADSRYSNGYRGNIQSGKSDGLAEAQVVREKEVAVCEPPLATLASCPRQEARTRTSGEPPSHGTAGTVVVRRTNGQRVALLAGQVLGYGLLDVLGCQY